HHRPGVVLEAMERRVDGPRRGEEGLPDLEALPQGGRHLDPFGCPPERRVIPVAGEIVDGEEFANAVNAVGDGLVVAGDGVLIQPLRTWEVIDQFFDSVLDEKDTRRLERLDETTG